MALTRDQIFTPATQQSWLTTLFANAVTVGLNTTSWRSGDPERAILTLFAYVLQYVDCIASQMSQGGLLDYAAEGTVTFEQPDGSQLIVPVSPDPSDPDQNPDGATTYLDELCSQNYLTERIRFTFAGGPLALLNTSGGAYGPFAIGEYHVSNPNNGATYANVASLTIAASSIVGTIVTGAVSSSGLIRVTTSTAHGRATDDAVFIAGILGTTEANGAWYITVLSATTFTLQGSTFTNTYTSGGLVYLPTVASFTADNGGSSSSSVNDDGVADVHTVTQAVTALVGVSVDNLTPFEGSDTESNIELRDRARLRLQSVSVNGPSGAYEFFGLSSITYAPLLSPPEAVSVKITRVRTVVDKITGHVFTFLANATGAPSSDDVDATDAVIQAYCVPLGVTAETFAATPVVVAYVAEVYLPAAYATDANEALLQAAVQAYIRTFPIGGLTDPGGDYTNVLPIGDALGVLFEAARDNAIPIGNATLTLNGGVINISLPVSSSSASVATLSPVVPTINFNPT
jgi:hypothetical protein